MADDPPVFRDRPAVLQQLRMKAAHARATVIRKKQTRVKVIGNARSRLAVWILVGKSVEKFS